MSYPHSAVPTPGPHEFDMLSYFHVNVGDPPRTEYEEFEARLRQHKHDAEHSPRVSPLRRAAGGGGGVNSSPQRILSEQFAQRQKKSYHQGSLYWFSQDPAYSSTELQRRTEHSERIKMEKTALNEHQYRLHRIHDMKAREKMDTYGKGRGPRVVHQTTDQRHHYGSLWFGSVQGDPVAPHLTKQQQTVGQPATPRRPVFHNADPHAHPLAPTRTPPSSHFQDPNELLHSYNNQHSETPS
eukprot:PhF_6_TR5252/c0_g1_i3/m.7627